MNERIPGDVVDHVWVELLFTLCFNILLQFLAIVVLIVPVVIHVKQVNVAVVHVSVKVVTVPHASVILLSANVTKDAAGSAPSVVSTFCAVASMEGHTYIMRMCKVTVNRFI